MLQILGYISGILDAAAFFPYTRDILRGKTKPQRASWLIWSILISIAFFSQLAKGATNSLWLTGVGEVGVTLTFFLSLKYGVGGLTRGNIAALVAAAMGLVLWFLTKEAAIALAIVIAINSIGALLTVVKAYQDPGSETMIAWALTGFSGIFSALAVGKLDLILLAYPIYISLANFSVAVAIIAGRRL